MAAPAQRARHDVVFRGRATFTLDDETVDAPAGTFIVRRERPDSPGVEVGEALWALSRGDRGAARELVTEAVAANPELRAALEQDPDLGRLLREP